VGDQAQAGGAVMAKRSAQRRSKMPMMQTA
jgi:hypothetical protein